MFGSVNLWISSTNYPTRRGCYLRADRRLRYLLLCHSSSMTLQALTLLLRLPLLREVIHKSFSYYCKIAFFVI